MTSFHGVIGYVVSWALSQAAVHPYLNNFTAALIVILSAGIASLCTCHQALGNTVVGLYVLLPGAYLIDQMFT